MIDNILTEILKQAVLVNKRTVAQTIEDANINIQFDPDGVIKNLSNLSKEDQQTPELLIEKMCTQYTEIKTTDIFLDACCGRGAMLVYLHERYNIPKDQLYGIEIKEENVRLLNKLGYHNIILGDILDDNTWTKLYDKLSYNIKGEDVMKFNKVIMNPPYSGNLHLKILEKVLQECRPEDGCEIVNLSPAGWLIDVENKTRTKYKYIYFRINNAILIDGLTAGRQFAISLPDGLAITIYNKKNIAEHCTFVPKIIFSIVNKISLKAKKHLSNYTEKNKIDSWRVEVKPQLPTGVDLSHLNTDSAFHKQRGGKICPDSSVFYNGKDKNGIAWFDTRTKGKTYKGNEPLPCSIKFNSEIEANNFKDSCHTNFYKNLVFIVRLNVNPRMTLLPYMEDYSHVWTDEDYCKFFGLNEEESKFMCRTVDDYRVKDFINYEEF